MSGARRGPHPQRVRAGLRPTTDRAAGRGSPRGSGFEDVEREQRRDERVRGVDDLRDPEVGGDAAEDVGGRPVSPRRCEVVDQLEQRAARRRPRSSDLVRPSSASGIPVVANQTAPAAAGVSKAGKREPRGSLPRRSARSRRRRSRSRCRTPRRRPARSGGRRSRTARPGRRPAGRASSRTRAGGRRGSRRSRAAGSCGRRPPPRAATAPSGSASATGSPRSAQRLLACDIPRQTLRRGRHAETPANSPAGSRPRAAPPRARARRDLPRDEVRLREQVGEEAEAGHERRHAEVVRLVARGSRLRAGRPGSAPSTKTGPVSGWLARGGRAEVRGVLARVAGRPAPSRVSSVTARRARRGDRCRPGCQRLWPVPGCSRRRRAGSISILTRRAAPYRADGTRPRGLSSRRAPSSCYLTLT